jgi:hypothetical protein
MVVSYTELFVNWFFMLSYNLLFLRIDVFSIILRLNILHNAVIQ